MRTFQKTSVFPALSVEDNVLIGLHLRGSAGVLAVLAGRRRVAAEERALAAEAAGIIEFVGLAHRRRERRQRVALRRAAAGRAGRRPRGAAAAAPARRAGRRHDRLREESLVSGLIRRVREQGVTILLVEHDMRMVMGISDTVIVLNDGRVIAEGTPAAIQAHPDVIRAYLGGSAASA